MKAKTNTAKGVHSYDALIDGNLVTFFNRNVSEYPTEAGSINFDLIPVTKQKDIMINHARMYAQQEYDRIMELVNVLQKQADAIKRRLEVTDAVHAAVYQFSPIMGQAYWLVWDNRKKHMILIHEGPDDWSTGAPVNYVYQVQVKYMGDHTWLELQN